MRRALTAIVLTCAVLGALPADAGIIIHPPPVLFSSGTIRGRLTFYNNQGGYCPTGRDCTGATYTQASWHTYNPVANVKVYLRDVNDQPLGESSTDSDGDFWLSWTALAGTTQAKIIWQAEQKEGRFAVRTTSGGAWVLWTYPFAITAGTTDSNPQDIGTLGWGDSTSPNAIANVYDGAHRMWDFGLVNSWRMQSYFVNIPIRAFTTRADCPTSCSDGLSVDLDSDPATPYEPQARVAHEMGHVASMKGSQNQSVKTCKDMSYDGQSGWDYGTPEWGCTGFEEGLATFLADAAFYWQNATAPTTCRALTSCADSQNLEAHPRCVTDSNRMALNIDRAFWDLYDRNADGETLSAALYQIIDTLADYPDGVDNHQKNEPWCSSDLTTLCYRDGRSTFDFMYHFNQLYNTPITDAFSWNCGWVGN